MSNNHPALYPIQGLPAIPWAVIAPHAQQAHRNHYQSLERLAQRAGTCPIETYYILRNEPYDVRNPVSLKEAKAYIDRRVAEFNGLAAVNKRLDEMASALEELLDDTQHLNHTTCGPSCPVVRARRVYREYEQWKESLGPTNAS